MFVDNFSDFSDLQINREKLAFMLFNLSMEIVNQCLVWILIPVEQLPLFYLGMPLLHRPLTSESQWMATFYR